MKHNIMDDELKKSNPRLYELRQKGDGFKMPDGYLDTLEDQVFGRIEAAGLQRQAPLKKRARRFSLPQILMAAAAVFALVLAAVWFFKPATTIEQSLASVELSEEDIENYLLENVQDFETAQLAMLPEVDENEYQPPTKQSSTKKALNTKEEITPEDVEHILNDMTDEELEKIL